LFNTSLYSEYKTVIDTFNFGLREIRRLTENAVESAWCDTEMKTELKEAISRCFSH
jgi:adenosine deaminase